MSELELEQRTKIKFLVKIGKCGKEIREILVLELEQRTNIKFLIKIGKSGKEIREILVKV